MPQNDEDFLSLLQEAPACDAPWAASTALVWRVLIVDDDADVHEATEFALADTTILGRRLQFLHAHSGQEALRLLQDEKDIAVVLLDVVMEHGNSGLEVVRAIREDLGISEARIVLRTGQPGYAPELDTIRDYDINDYKTKSELSRSRLFTTLTSAIRTYEQIHALNMSRIGLDKVIRASSQLDVRQGARQFAAGVVAQMAELLNTAPEGLVCAHVPHLNPQKLYVLAAAGRFAHAVEQVLTVLDPADPAVAALEQAMGERRSVVSASAAALYFVAKSGQAMVACLATPRPLDEHERRLLDVFCSHMATSLESVVLFKLLNEHAYNDQLLHISNRLAFVRAVDDTMASGRQGKTLGLIDIDHFSHLNDALGHHYGDVLLKAVAARLQHNLPARSTLARVDGDTFGVLGTDDALAPATLLNLFAEPFNLGGMEHSVSASIGLVRLTETDGDGSDAVKAASIALKRAKEGTRGECSYYTRQMEEETRHRVQLLQDLRMAYDRQHLFVVYQPQYTLNGRQVIGAEALLRWRTEDGRFIPPDRFISLAESSGLIVALGAWVMRTACTEQRRLLSEGVRTLRMAVNVSVAQFRHPGFLPMVDAVLADTGINPDHLELEITESVAMLDADFMVNMLHQLKQRGLSVAIDDFGTGFSSLSYLERLQVDRLKIDRSFVSQMSRGQSSRRIVETVVQLGHSLGLELIAEGVETEEEAHALQAMGCQEAQGYLFSKPLPRDELLGFLLAQQNALGN